MKDIAIYGAGGFGRETALLIQQINQEKATWNLLGFFDDRVKGEVDTYPVLGNMDTLNAWETALSIAIAIADPAIKKKVHQQIRNSYVSFPTLMHPRFEQGALTNTVGEGCILTSGSIMTTNVNIRDFVIINLLTTIGHDVTVGAYSSIMPNCSISGNVSIGEGCFLGAGAKVLQNITLGDLSIVGAGAVVTKSVSPGKTVVGLPAR